MNSFTLASPRWVIAAALIPVIGCGLEEYEAKLKVQRDRIEYIDRENQLLGEPIQPPPKKVDPVAPPPGTAQAQAPAVQTELDLFFRPPKGVLAKYDDQAYGVFRRYAGSGKPPWGPATTPQGGGPGMQVAKSGSNTPFQEVYVASTSSLNREDFLASIWATPFFAAVNPDRLTTEMKRPLDRPEMTFESISFTLQGTPPVSYFAYFYRGQSGQVAIMYTLTQDKATDEQLETVRNFSLQSLALGTDMMKARARVRPK